MVVIQDDVTGLGVDLSELEGDVDFLFNEQFIQDERLLILEQDSDAFDDEIESKCVFEKMVNFNV